MIKHKSQFQIIPLRYFVNKIIVLRHSRRSVVVVSAIATGNSFTMSLLKTLIDLVKKHYFLNNHRTIQSITAIISPAKRYLTVPADMMFLPLVSKLEQAP